MKTNNLILNYYDVKLFKKEEVEKDLGKKVEIKNNYLVEYPLDSKLNEVINDPKQHWKLIDLLTELIEEEFEFEFNMESYKVHITDSNNTINLKIDSKDFE